MCLLTYPPTAILVPLFSLPKKGHYTDLAATSG